MTLLSIGASFTGAGPALLGRQLQRLRGLVMCLSSRKAIASGGQLFLRRLLLGAARSRALAVLCAGSLLRAGMLGAVTVASCMRQTDLEARGIAGLCR
jgi:hypothetical protein